MEVSKLDIKLSIHRNRREINTLRKSINLDKQVLKTEDSAVKNMYVEQAIRSTNNELALLDIESDVQDLEDAVLKKESALNSIKNLFKSSNVPATLNGVAVSNIPETLNSPAFYNDLLMGEYGFIQKIVNGGKIEYSDIKANFAHYADLVNEEASFLKDLKLFSIENILSTDKIDPLGYKLNHKHKLLNNQKLTDIYNFKLSKIEKQDKVMKLNVYEYRYLLITVGNISSIYLLKYCKDQDVYFMTFEMLELVAKKKIPNKELTLDKETIIDLLDTEELEVKYHKLPSSDMIYEGNSALNQVFIEKCQAVVSGAKHTPTLYNNLNNKLSEDYAGLWDTEFPDTPEKDLLIYIHNMVWENYYENEDQGTYGNLSELDYKWGVYKVLERAINKK